MTSDIDPFLQEFPESSRQILKAGWDSLPPLRRQELLDLIPAVPGTPGQIQKIFALSHQQIQMAFGGKQDVVIVGPANVGKSTLYNRLIASRADEAAVSPVPGTTRQNQAGDAGPFTIVDTPGADAVGEVGQRERDLALAAAAGADLLIILFDAVQGVKQTEQELFRALQALHRPYVVVLNKIDLVGREAEPVVVQVAANLGLPPEQVIPISATRGQNLAAVVMAVVKAEPALLAALGQGLPAYRTQLAWRAATGAATTAALIGLTPLPFVDFVPLVAVQISMILGIGRIFNYRITPGRWRELLGVFGLGLLGRTLFYELIKLGGPPAWVVSAAVAAGTTVTMGYAAILWFSRGERLTRATAQRISRTLSSALVDSIKSLGRRRPSREELLARIEEVVGEAGEEVRG